MIQKKIRNIALFAHVDAGKTSLTEQFLFLSGKIKKIGSVDKGNAQTDNLEVEKDRGITVNSSVLTFYWGDTQFNLIDTPGHIDFSSESENAILAIDAAVVVVSAVEGVQAQTENLVSLLKKHQKPFIIFVNKIDREGADIENVLAEFKTDLDLQTINLNRPINISSSDADIETLWDKEHYQSESDLIESIVEFNDDLFEAYLSGESLSYKLLNDQLKNAVQNRQMYPVLYGSAKFSLGVEELMHAIVSYLPAPELGTEDLKGIVFKTYHHKGEGKLAAIRLFSGELKSRSTIYNASKLLDEKVSLIKNTDLQNSEIISAFASGEMAWVQGLKTAEPGDFIGTVSEPDRLLIDKTPSLLTVQVIPENPSEINSLVDALQILNNEDPNLNLVFLKEERELHINIKGEVQKEILQSIIPQRFALNVSFSDPTVIYKETPTQEAEGYVRYWMPKPCWAIMKFKIEPNQRGAGLTYSSQIGVNDVKQHYQNDVEKTIPEALKQGVLGWEVDDIKITLIEGEDHEMHTKSNDFAIATPMGILDGLSKANMQLLEPVLDFKLSAPEDALGNIISELLKLRAQFDNPVVEKGKCVLSGSIPVATSLNFPITLSALTSGKAKYKAVFSSYQLCDNDLGKTREYRGISPLDTAKYILKARKALS